jgi:hypothetical protein
LSDCMIVVYQRNLRSSLHAIWCKNCAWVALEGGWRRCATPPQRAGLLHQ